jgi:predicted GNAT superfamily acetyltransferase
VGTEPPVEIVELAPDDLRAAGDLIGRVWGTPPGRALLDDNTFRALHLAGEQLLGAYGAGRVGDAGALLGVSIAFVGTHPGGIHLHSHITGIDPAHQGSGVGFALKLAQRDWALARGIDEVRWTFDPLIARNAHFNLTKLGAVGIAYHVNLYGEMPDATNAGDESDRVEAIWDLSVPVGRPEPDVEQLRADGAGVVLGLDGSHWPETGPLPVLLACVPADIVALRRSQPAAARAWRIAARTAMGYLLGLGYRATGATRDGWWVLERPNGTAA